MGLSANGLRPTIEAFEERYPACRAKFLPIVDAPPTEWAIVWSTTKIKPQVRSFAETILGRGRSTTAALRTDLHRRRRNDHHLSVVCHLYVL